MSATADCAVSRAISEVQAFTELPFPSPSLCRSLGPPETILIGLRPHERGRRRIKSVCLNGKGSCARWPTLCARSLKFQEVSFNENN